MFSVQQSNMVYDANYKKLPTIYVVTRVDVNALSELADLTRMKNTLRLVPKLKWLLIEPYLEKSFKLSKFVNESNMDIVHLAKVINKEKDYFNFAIYWLRVNYLIINPIGVVYFANTQSVYDLRLFEEVCKNI